MAFTIEIPGRTIIGSGSVVLDPSDRELSFNLEGLVYRLRLFPTATPDPLIVEFNRQHTRHVNITIRGQLPLFTASWKLTALGFVGDDRIDLDLMIFSQSDQPDCVRQVSFTFTLTRGVGAPSREEMGLA